MNNLKNKCEYNGGQDGRRTRGQEDAVSWENPDKKCAFTLAETLITLVIVGVVAALTVPSMIAKYQHQQLEAQFKRSVATISQLVLFVKSDLNENHLAQFCTEYTPDRGYSNASICNSSMTKYLNSMKKKAEVKYLGDVSRWQENILTYNGKSSFNQNSSYTAIFYTTKMTDGSFLGTNTNNTKLTFAIDSNGYKKPNKVGHDIFLFEINKNNDSIQSWGIPNNDITDEQAEQYGNSKKSLKEYYKDVYGNPCNLTTTRSGNGIGCTYYALKNECPYDKTLKYFECLP